MNTSEQSLMEARANLLKVTNVYVVTWHYYSCHNRVYLLAVGCTSLLKMAKDQCIKDFSLY